LGAWLGFTELAHAEDTKTSAQRLFAQAEHEFSSGHYEQAAHLFEEADAQSPHPSAVYNAAVCWDQSGQLARAADGYLEALGRGGLDDKQTMDAESRLGALRGQLGFIQIIKPVGGLASVAHKQRQPVPTRLYLSPGDYEVLLEATDGGSSQTPITAIAGETLRVELRLPPAATSEATGSMTSQPNTPPPMDAPRDPSPTARTLGWVSIGLGIAATGAAIYMGTRALTEKENYHDAARPPSERNRALSSAEDLQLGTNVAWGAAGVFSGTGLVLLLASPTWEF
jgi:tetratricopeptide (TPR) repeat protein